jgi:hypothetical protein
MAIVHPPSVRDTVCNAVVDSIDTGGAGTLEFLTNASPGVEVATITFQATAFGASSGGTATMNTPTTDDTNAAGGTAAQFIIKNGSAAKAGFAGSVTATTDSPQGDITLSSVSIGAGDTVSLTSLSYSAMP